MNDICCLEANTMRFKAARDFLKTDYAHMIMEYERRKRMNDILVIQAPFHMKQEAFKRTYDQILKQMESGLVILPAGFSVTLCPKDVEVKLMDSSNDIFEPQESEDKG